MIGHQMIGHHMIGQGRLVQRAGMRANGAGGQVSWQRRATGVLMAGLMVAALALSACRDTKGGDLFEISGKLFSFNYRVATAVYIVTLKPLQPMQDGQLVVATFDNPAGGDAIVVEQKVWPKLDHVTIESPGLECVVKDRPYRASIVIKGADGQELQKLETTITSDLDQSILPDRPLVIGPVYELNPDMAGHPDGKLPGGRGVTCPAQAG